MSVERAYTKSISCCQECHHWITPRDKTIAREAYIECCYYGNIRALTYNNYRYELPDWCPLPAYHNYGRLDQSEQCVDMEMQCATTS